MKDRITVTDWSSTEQRNSFPLVFRDYCTALGLRAVLNAIDGIHGPPPEDAERLREERLKLEVRATLAAERQSELDRHVIDNPAENSAAGLYRWVMARFVVLGEAQYAVDDANLARYTWKSTKLSFQQYADGTSRSCQALFGRGRAQSS